MPYEKKTRSRPRQNRRTLALESLEARQPLAAQITPTLVDGVLTVERGFLTAVEARGLYETSVRCADILGFDPDLEWGSFAGAIFPRKRGPCRRRALFLFPPEPQCRAA